MASRTAGYDLLELHAGYTFRVQDNTVTLFARATNLLALQFDGEAFHLWMVLAVIPISIYALTMGCKQHKRYRLLGLGLIGLLFLLSAVVAGVGDFWEQALTVTGAAIIAFGHYWNYRLCRRHLEVCACPEHLDE